MSKPPVSHDDSDLQAAVRALYSDATDFVDHYLAPIRTRATQFYNGAGFGTEEDGRSQVVLNPVRDTVLAILPNLLRIFCGTEKCFEYQPRTAQAVAAAEQATDYVGFVINEDNPGYQIFSAVLMDALIRRCGVVKYWWDESTEISEERYSGLSFAQAALVKQSDDVEVVEEEIKIVEHDDDPDQPPRIDEPTVNLIVRRKVNAGGRARLMAVPPEEFLIDRRARDVASALYCAHRAFVPVSDLVAMGYDYDEVKQHAQSDTTLGTFEGLELLARQPAAFLRTDTDNDPSRKLVLYVEHYLRYDSDGDGISELHKVCTIGNACGVLDDEIVDAAPFALFNVLPEPHTPIGLSIYDLIGDLQVIQSHIMRNTLDSLAQSIHPRTIAVESQVNLDDLLNTEVGSIVRVKQPGAVQPLTTDFVGAPAMQVMEFINEIQSGRTGISAASQGLNPELLQSTTAQGVAAMAGAADERCEMMARNLAEGGMRALARGLLKLLTRNQSKSRVLRLRGQWVEVNPCDWGDLDVCVSTGNGRGSDASRLAALVQIASKQESILQMLGPTNPLVGPDQLRNTYSKIMEAMGFKDSNQFFKAIPPGYQPPQQPPPPPDPAVLQIQATQQVAQLESQIQQMKLQFEAQKLQLDDDRARQQMHIDAAIKIMAINAQFGSKFDISTLEAAVDAQQADADRQHQLQQQVLQQQAEQQQAAAQRAHEAALAQAQAQQAQMMKATDIGHKHAMAAQQGFQSAILNEQGHRHATQQKVQQAKIGLQGQVADRMLNPPPAPPAGPANAPPAMPGASANGPDAPPG